MSSNVSLETVLNKVLKSFNNQRRSSQPITWLILTYYTVHKYKYKTANLTQNTAQHKLPPLDAIKLRHSARKQDGLILQHCWAHMGWLNS